MIQWKSVVLTALLRYSQLSLAIPNGRRLLRLFVLKQAKDRVIEVIWSHDVYHMKLDEYITYIKSGEAFGPIQAVVYTVEFQKRGLPHSHTLTWLTAQSDEPSPAFIDVLICAEIPDIAADKFGFGLVDEFMIHGPCGEYNPSCPCMKDGRCSKGYPKKFCDATTIDDDGYPIYRRRDDGRFVVKNGVSLDNRWVVPYNPGLLKKFQAHINVEWCNKTYLIKYLFKYINKGSDCTMFTFRNSSSGQAEAHAPNSAGIDEIMQYIKSRYLSICESFWRLYGFEIHGRTSVERLIVHLPNMQFVTYHEEADLEEVIEDPDSSRTMLTEWFVANQRHIFTRDLTYCEFPSKFNLDPNTKVWTKCRIGTKIGRLRHIHPSVGEPFYLRMLLMVVGVQRAAIPDVMLQNTLLKELDAMFSSNGLSISSYNLPTPVDCSSSSIRNRLILEELSFNQPSLHQEYMSMYARLNSDQKMIYDKVFDRIAHHEKCVFFISGHGGTGKTFLWNAIMANLRSRGEIVLAVASSGVAALLMPGGRTAHSRFRIPIDIHDRSMCTVRRGTILGDLIKKTSLIIWDEAPMTHKLCFEALDRTRRDIQSADDPANEHKPFGGKPILLGGDFRQVLPVIEQGTRADVVDASLVRSALWKHVEVLHLTINMRLHNPSLSQQERGELAEFAKWVLDRDENGADSFRPLWTKTDTDTFRIG